MVTNIRLLALDIDGVLTDGTAIVGQDGHEGKRINYQDLDAVTEARNAGFEIALVTGETTPAVDLIAQRFNIQRVIKGAKDKVAALTQLADQLGVSLSDVCYVGDSNRDAAALSHVGFGVAPANATSAAKEAAHCVLQNSGGMGAVAETVTVLLRSQARKDAEDAEIMGERDMKCYLCERENLTVLATQLRSGPGTVLYCDECEIGFLQHKTSDLQAFYDEEYRKKYGPNVHTSSNYAEIFDSYVNYQQQRLDLLKPYLGSEKKLLEVGCSTGHFLYNVKDLVGEAIGVDYDSGATTFAAEKCGCATFGCGLDDAGPPLASFDIVCAFQTMEHVNEPVQFAAMLRKYLKPDGVVFIEVPNLRDPLLSIYNNTAYRDFWFRDVHVFYFTSRSLKTVMQRAGFSGDVYFSQDYNFLNHLSWILRNAPQETCHEGLSSPRLPISEQVSPELRKDLNAWLQSIDKDYKALLATHGTTSNISFIGELA